MASATFDAYGSRISTDGSADPYSGYGAQLGYYTDAETGLQLLGNRYYNPAAGRFLTRDPIGYAGGTNLYSYCGNNPVSGADPWGTSDFFTGMFMGYMRFCLQMGNLTGNKDYTRAVNIMFPPDPCDGFNYDAPFIVASMVSPEGLEANAGRAAEVAEDAMANLNEIEALGGKGLGEEDISKLRDSFAPHGINVVVDDPLLDEKSANGLFSANTATITLSSNSTEYVAFHEAAHARQFIEVGKDVNAYIKIGQLGREEFVYQQIMDNKSLFNQAELDHAADQIEYYRKIASWGTPR